MKTYITTEKADACGFTLVELLLVIVLIVLIAGLGGGSYVGTYKRALVEKSAIDFMLAAMYARITAIERQNPCRIKLDTTNNKFALNVEEFNRKTGQTEQVLVRDSYFKPAVFGDTVRFEGIQIQPAGLQEAVEDQESPTIVFWPDGTAQSATIQIGDGQNNYTIDISGANGRVKVYFGKAENVKFSTIDLDER